MSRLARWTQKKSSLYRESEFIRDDDDFVSTPFLFLPHFLFFLSPLFAVYIPGYVILRGFLLINAYLDPCIAGMGRNDDISHQQ
jgi:hypothetical protein